LGLENFDVRVASQQIRQSDHTGVNATGLSETIFAEPRQAADAFRLAIRLNEMESAAPTTYASLMTTVGRTPLVELGRLAKNLPGRVFAKLEMRNPCGSVKDRVGVALIQDAEARGVLQPGMTIMEATGGNTGVGLAFVSAIRGYRLILTMPETMSVERVALLKQLGAKVVLTSGILMHDAVTRAEQIAKQVPGAIILDQFKNPANPRSTEGPQP